MNPQQSLSKPLSPGIESIPFDGHLVLIKDGCEIIVLNETARLMWEALAEGATVAALASEMAERFGLSRERATADVETALAEWQVRGLIGRKRRDQPSTPPKSSPAQIPPTNFAFDRTYALCGHPVRFRFRDPDAEGLLHPLLSPSEVSGATTREVIDLYRDGADHVIAANGSEIGRSRLAEEVLGLALGRVLEVSYPDAHWLAMFHAGVVANDHRAIILAGASGSGKSTLTAALVDAGLHYLSDDVAPLDGRSLHVVPMPFAVSLKRGSWPTLAPRFPELKHLPVYSHGPFSRRYLNLSKSGSRRCSGMPVQALVFPQYQADAPGRMKQIRPGQSLAHLLVAGGWLSLSRQNLSSLLDWLIMTPGYQISYCSIEEAIGMLCDDLMFNQEREK